MFLFGAGKDYYCLVGSYLTIKWMPCVIIKLDLTKKAGLELGCLDMGGVGVNEQNQNLVIFDKEAFVRG